jgi:hypothetical protein
MADPVSKQKRPEPAPLTRPPAQQDVPRHRFGIAYLALAAILGAAVGLFVVLAGNGGKNSGPAWSAWKPTDSNVQSVDQIAKYVGPEYALPSGRQLVGVLSSAPLVQGTDQAVPVRAIAVTSGLPGRSSNDAQFFSAGSAWTYHLCGFGKNCAISEGKASIERGQLLRREALELALYTFKYDKSVDSLVTFMPPALGGQPKAVLFFRRGDLQDALKVPLAQTLPPPRTRLLAGRMSTNDLERVREFADPHVYSFQFQQLADGSAIMVLQPPTAS